VSTKWLMLRDIREIVNETLTPSHITPGGVMTAPTLRLSCYELLRGEGRTKR
jgi:hypothetical protein